MKKSNKVLLIIASLFGLGYSVGILSLFYPIPHITYVMKRFQERFPSSKDVFIGYSLFLCLCFLLILLIVMFLPGKSNEIVIFKDKGKLHFSKQTIETTVQYSFADVVGIHSSKVRVKLDDKPDKTKIYVKLSLNDSGKMIDLAQTVQERIESILTSSLGFAAKSIDIKVVEFKPDGKYRKEDRDDEVKKSRVV